MAKKKKGGVTSTKLTGPFSHFQLRSDVNSKVFRHTKRFSVAQVGGDEKCFSKTLS